MAPLELVGLPPLMRLTSGGGVIVGMLDGPVNTGHADLHDSDIHVLDEGGPGAESDADGPAMRHGTFVAGILAGRRGGAAAAICPSSHLIVRPIFTTARTATVQVPSTSPKVLAKAICECIHAGVRVLNLSVAIASPTTRNEPGLDGALNYAARRGVIVVAAAGNQGTLGSTAITRHPAVIPVVGYRHDGQPMALSNLGASAGKRGLGAPGEGVTSLGAKGGTLTLSGTSLAAPFVTGAIALLWSQFPSATPGTIRRAALGSIPRKGVVPPLLDAWVAYQSLSSLCSMEASS
jgi:subtilisin family serine protease